MANPFDIAKKLIAWGERAGLQGLDFNDLQWSMDDPGEMKRVVAFLRDGPCGPFIGAHRVAFEFGDPLVSDSFIDANPDHQESHTTLSYLRGGPLPLDADLSVDTEMIRAYGNPPDRRPGFLTFFDVGLSVQQMCDLCKRRGIPFFRRFNLDWPAGTKPHAWMLATSDPQWRQFRIRANPVMYGKSLSQQYALLPRYERHSSARTIIMAMLLHQLAKQSALFVNHWVRSCDVIEGNAGGTVCLSSQFDHEMKYSVLEDRGYDALDIASEYVL